MKRPLKIIVYSAVIILLLMMPMVLQNPRWFHLVITVGIYILLAGGLRLVIDVGQLSTAHAGFMGIGAYSSTILSMKLGLSFWIALPLSGMIGGIMAILIGVPLLRLKGPYFFVITLAFGEILRMTFISWQDLFGGAVGISGIPLPDPIKAFGLNLEFSSHSVHFYYLLLILLLPSFYVFYRLEKSRFALVWSAIREYDSLAQSFGINLMYYKVMAFFIACVLAGLTGSFYAHYMSYISPGSFTLNESLLLVIMVVLGGTESIFGVIIGVILLTLISELGRAAVQFQPMIYGASLLLILLFVPGGLWDLRKPLLRKFSFLTRN